MPITLHGQRKWADAPISGDRSAQPCQAFATVGGEHCPSQLKVGETVVDDVAEVVAQLDSIPEGIIARAAPARSPTTCVPAA